MCVLCEREKNGEREGGRVCCVCVFVFCVRERWREGGREVGRDGCREGQ